MENRGICIKTQITLAEFKQFGELISNELNTASRTKTRDDGVGHSFQRSRGHRMVDSSLDLYGHAVETLMSRMKQPIPRAVGSGTNRRGLIGTAPLRRYIDGIAQRQALSALCGYGVPLTVDECREASKIAARASDSINNIHSSKQLHIMLPRNRRQVSALYELARHLESTGGIQNRRRVKAVSTGHNNEVVIIGVGATGKCKGIRGTLKSGERLLVQVDRIDPESGTLEVMCVCVCVCVFFDLWLQEWCAVCLDLSRSWLFLLMATILIPFGTLCSTPHSVWVSNEFRYRRVFAHPRTSEFVRSQPRH